MLCKAYQTCPNTFWRCNEGTMILLFYYCVQFGGSYSPVWEHAVWYGLQTRRHSHCNEWKDHRGQAQYKHIVQRNNVWSCVMYWAQWVRTAKQEFTGGGKVFSDGNIVEPLSISMKPFNWGDRNWRVKWSYIVASMRDFSALCDGCTATEHTVILKYPCGNLKYSRLLAPKMPCISF